MSPYRTKSITLEYRPTEEEVRNMLNSRLPFETKLDQVPPAVQASPMRQATIVVLSGVTLLGLVLALGGMLLAVFKGMLSVAWLLIPVGAIYLFMRALGFVGPRAGS